MQFNLHADYVKAAAPRVEPHALAQAGIRREQPPPRPVRSGAARALAVVARRLDGDAARRAIA